MRPGDISPGGEGKANRLPLLQEDTQTNRKTNQEIQNISTKIDNRGDIAPVKIITGVEIICVEEALPKSFENELVEDMLSLLSVFTAKLHGKRSSKNRKKNESLS
jgi:predicted site-specific integrase-resolvase